MGGLLNVQCTDVDIFASTKLEGASFRWPKAIVRKKADADKGHFASILDPCTIATRYSL